MEASCALLAGSWVDGQTLTTVDSKSVRRERMLLSRQGCLQTYVVDPATMVTMPRSLSFGSYYSIGTAYASK